jgi:hypothetical protein
MIATRDVKSPVPENIATGKSEMLSDFSEDAADADAHLARVAFSISSSNYTKKVGGPPGYPAIP